MLNQGVHGIDLLLWMLGEPVKTIFGYAGTLARQTGVEDTAAALLTMDSGALCVIKNTTLAYPEFPTGFCIHGEKDFRILANQAMAAFDAAVMRGVPAELLIYPDENHWVLKPQNGVLWQRTFFEWLDKWLKPAK